MAETMQMGHVLPDGVKGQLKQTIVKTSRLAILHMRFTHDDETACIYLLRAVENRREDRMVTPEKRLLRRPQP